MMSDDLARPTEEEWKHQWNEVLANARMRPPMFIGSQERGHLLAIREPLRLVWEAKAFRKPVSASVLLSPHQYIVRCMTGPLFRPIQRMFPFRGAHVIGEDWRSAIKRLQSERFSYSAWNRCFGSSIGPTLDSPMMPLFLARRFVIGMRTDEGLWCQTFERGWPETSPFLLQDPSPVGLLTAAELDPEWFTGLPFIPEVASLLASFPAVHLEWRPTDDLLNSEEEPIDRVRKLFVQPK